MWAAQNIFPCSQGTECTHLPVRLGHPASTSTGSRQHTSIIDSSIFRNPTFWWKLGHPNGHPMHPFASSLNIKGSLKNDCRIHRPACPKLWVNDKTALFSESLTLDRTRHDCPSFDSIPTFFGIITGISNLLMSVDHSCFEPQMPMAVPSSWIWRMWPWMSEKAVRLPESFGW